MKRSEIRMTKSERNPNDETRIVSFVALQPVSRFGFRASFVIRHSSFVIGHSSSAFTLMEVMLALVVSAIVLAGIGGVFYSAIRLRDRTTAMLDESLPLHQAFSFLRRDLQGTLPPNGTYSLAGDFKTEQLGGGIGQNFRLQFFTSTGIINDNAPWGEIQEISYELRDPITRSGGTGRELIRSINRNLLATGIQEPEEQFLLGNVQSLEFSCFDGSDWRESWDTSLSD